MAGVKVGIEVKGAGQLQKALRVLGEADAPFLRAALEESGRDLAGQAARRAPGGIGRAVQFTGVKGKANGLRAVGVVKHPGSRSMEFGRKFWMRRGQRIAHSPGQRPRPYLGVVQGDAAIGAVKEDAQRRIADAFEREWERIGAET